MSYVLHGVSFLVGVLMAVGLAVAGMTQPHKIVAFLDLTGAWEPDLIVVMGSAVVTTFVAYRLAARNKTPLLGGRFLIPTRRDIDRRLVGGALLFGAGWGLTGICPGPAITSLPTGASGILVFCLGMVAGMLLLALFDRAAPAVRTRIRGSGGLGTSSRRAPRGA